MSNIKCRGELVTKEELKRISSNYSLSYHAKCRIAERRPDLNITEALLNPILAYYNTDGTANIAVSPVEYFVVDASRDPCAIITYKEESHYGNTIFKKRKLAQQGKDRIPYKHR